MTTTLDWLVADTDVLDRGQDLRPVLPEIAFEIIIIPIVTKGVMIPGVQMVLASQGKDHFLRRG